MMSYAADNSEIGNMNLSTFLRGKGVRLLIVWRKVGLENDRQNRRHIGNVTSANIDVPSDTVSDGGCSSSSSSSLSL